MLVRCDCCGGKFDKDEAWEMNHCGGVYEEVCGHCLELLAEEATNTEDAAWHEMMEEWGKEDE